MKKIASPLFQDLSEAELDTLAAAGHLRTRQFAKHEVIFHAGSCVREIGIVLRGSVHIENLDLWGTKSILSSVGAGQAFAETYAFCGEALMVDAVAAEHCEILFLHTAALTDARIEPALKDKLLRRLLAVSMRKNFSLSQRIFCTTPKTVRGRLLTYFSAQAARCGRMAFEVPFNRQQMADYLNLDRSALSKELCKMRDEGLLTFEKKYEERDAIMAFNAKMGFPVCFDDVEIDESEFEAMARKVVTATEWAYRPKGVTIEDFIACMKEQNRCGRAYKKTL